MRNNLAYAEYGYNNTSIESKERLIEMLYEGILKFTSYSIRAIESDNIEKRTYWINKTTAIFVELQNSLKNVGGNMSEYLNGLYSYQIDLLISANINSSIKNLNTVISVTKSLLEAWREETGLNSDDN